MKITTLLLLLAMWMPPAFSGNGPAAARVNGEEISEFRLERYFVEYLEDQGRAVASIRNPKAYKQLRQAALDTLIDRELLWQEAVKRGVVISDATVLAQVDQTRQAIGGPERFARQLEDAGFDEPAFVEYTRRDLAARQVFTTLTEASGPDEQQVRAFFEEHRAAVKLHLINLQNHSEAADVTEEQGLETVRAYLARQQKTQVRLQVLARLRASARIERIDDE